MRKQYKDRRTRGVAVVNPSYVYEGFEIDSLKVLRKGRGGGSRIMQRILDDADKENVNLYLVVVPSGPMDEEQLQAWYRRLGFDNHGTMRMRRIPASDRGSGKNRSIVRNRKGH